MKKEILIYPIKSILSNDNLISQDSQLLLDSLIDLSNHTIVFKYIDDLKEIKDNPSLYKEKKSIFAKIFGFK